MKKLKMSALTLTLYVFAILSLAYTVYFVYTTYESLVTYYSSYSFSAADIINYIIQNCYTPFGITIILYGLAGISDLFYDILNPEEEKSQEEGSEEVESEEVAEVNEDTVSRFVDATICRSRSKKARR